MASGNWVQETTATTGTGTMTLVAVADQAEFIDVVAEGTAVNYVILDDNGNKETGRGTTGALKTLARTTPQSTLVSGTYDNTTPTAITLSGSATVMLSVSAEDTFINSATGTDAVVVGGNSNVAAGNYSTVGGGISNSIDRENSVIGGGTGNLLQTNAYDCVIGGGNGNSMTTNPLRSTIAGGFNNTITGGYSFIGGGWIHSISAAYGTIGGGYDNTVTATHGTVAGGNNNDSTGTYAAIAGGDSNLAGAAYNAIGGGQSNTSGDNTGTHATIGGGQGNIASDPHSTVGGGNSNDAGHSFATIGGGTLNGITANGGTIAGGTSGSVTGLRASLLGGSNNDATASYATNVAGRGSNANHLYSAVMGGGALTRADYDVVIGAAATDTPAVANNTIRFQGTGGNIKIDGAVTTPEADYAEMFEWYDQNPDKEERAGYFVSLHQGKIVKGAGRDDKSSIANYLASLFTSPNSATNVPMVGVISATPSIVGDGAPNHWSGRNKKDKFGRKQQKEYDLYSWEEVVESTVLYDDVEHLVKTSIPHEVYVDVQNGNKYSEYPQYSHKGILSTTVIPAEVVPYRLEFADVEETYDDTIPYIPRSDRDEWDAVGMLGKLIVHSAEPITSNWVKPSVGGRALNAANGVGYQVLEVIDNFTVRILFK